MQFEGLIPPIYMFFDTGNPTLRFNLKPEVELIVILRMRSNKVTKNQKNARKMPFEGLISRMYMFFDTGNPNLRSIVKQKVELRAFLRMRSNKITKDDENCL